MKNLLSTLIILICSSAYTQTDSIRQQTKKHGVFYPDTIKITPTPHEIRVDTTNGIKTRVVNNKIYYIRETQKIIIKHEEKD
tara:strand:+ start:131 stop:376 length:246 start_codon:yes stop_codon:yes gene_type:complete